jgi:hypothetical protein
MRERSFWKYFVGQTHPLSSFPSSSTFLVDSIGTDSYGVDQWDNFENLDKCMWDFSEHSFWRKTCILHMWTDHNASRMICLHKQHILQIEGMTYLLNLIHLKVLMTEVDEIVILGKLFLTSDGDDDYCWGGSWSDCSNEGDDSKVWTKRVRLKKEDPKVLSK